MTKSFLIKWFSFSLLILVVIASTVNAQLQKQVYQVLGVSVEGQRSSDVNMIISNSGIRVGDEIQIPGDATNEAIERLWKLGVFEDVQLIIDKKVNDGVFLKIVVKEYPRLEQVEVSGNDEIDEDDIKDEVSFFKNQILKPQDVFRVISKIENLYLEEGFLNATIEPVYFKFEKADTTDESIVVSWTNNNDISDTYETEVEFIPGKNLSLIPKMRRNILLLFKIQEGKEVEISDIRFVGNEIFEDDDLVSEFEETSEPKWWKFWGNTNFKKEDYLKDKDLLKKFYQKNGYVDFEILSDTLIFSENKENLDIEIDVHEGPQYKVRNIDWKGNTVYPDSVLTERLNFRKGDIYNLERFQQNLMFNEKKTDVSSLYQDNGYLASSLTPSDIKVAEDSLDILITVRENNRFKIGEVSIEGNTKTMDKIVRRELYTVPGDYFNRNYLHESIQKLANLQYFNVEELYKTGVDYRLANDSTVNLVYNVIEKSSDYLNASVGYNQAFGFSGSMGITLTNFSMANPFQMGGGQILSFNWQFGVGNFYRTFQIGFTEPWLYDTPTLVGFDVFDTRQRFIYDLRQSGGTLKVGRRLNWPDKYFNVQGSLRFQYNDIINGNEFYREGTSRQLTTGLTISRIDIDNPIFPSQGSKVILNFELSGGPFLPGDVDYYKADLNMEWYTRMFNTHRVTFYAGAEIGFIKELVKGTPIQPFELYYMGGNGLVIATTPLRGYPDREVGPNDSRGNVIGGKVKLKYVAEIRGALSLEPIPIYLIAFMEAGNVYEKISSANPFDLRRSAGFGARIFMNPIGLLGFDYGYGFDRRLVDGKDSQWEFHFQFGKGF